MEHTSFAYYKLPDKQHYRYIGSNTPPLHIPNLSSLTDFDSGFLIAPFDEKQYKQSVELIKLQMQALIARDLWGMNEYYYTINAVNESIRKAIELLREN